ncbi:MAG: hypothetical protein L3J28_05815 [Candidatus Polarisedimenticolaceae bacterium]|nr:hypothetical protein [Candidatus Polarisedimenticolaceae bacterium]
MTEKVNHSLWLIAAGLLLILLSAVGYKLWPMINPQVVTTLPFDAGCDLQRGPCSTEMADGQRITLSIEPRPIPLVAPLQFQVKLDGVEAEKVFIDIQGLGMNMGINRPQLTAQSAGDFSGEGMLPVCIRNSMEWEVSVLLETGSGMVAVPFRFVTDRH